MPFYEFQCKQCGSVFEDFVEMGTKHVWCPRCNDDLPKTKRHPPVLADRILSPTMTTFRMASNVKKQ